MNWFNILKDEEDMESQRVHPQIERTTMMGMQMPMEMRALREFQTINMEDPCCEYIRDEMEKYFTDMFYQDTNMSRENTVQDMKTLVKYIKELDCKEINELMQPENADPTLRGIHFPRKRFLDQ